MHQGVRQGATLRDCLGDVNGIKENVQRSRGRERCTIPSGDKIGPAVKDLGACFC
ncbi:hypothetical protein VAEU17_330038 [Vibrio aestuarianus]|nr:hypothetical protein VAEU17_330038 [Vibrio aestuarianus]